MNKSKKTKNLLIIIVLIAVVAIAVGYATMAQNLILNGTVSTLSKEDWNVHFVQNSNEMDPVASATSDHDGVYDQTFTLNNDLLEGTFSVTLAPGASIDYDVDVTNDGKLHAVADGQEVEITGAAQDKINCVVTPTVVQDLYKEGTETTGPDHYKVTISCADSDELPDATQTATVKVTFKYVQKHTN